MLWPTPICKKQPGPLRAGLAFQADAQPCASGEIGFGNMDSCDFFEGEPGDREIFLLRNRQPLQEIQTLPHPAGASFNGFPRKKHQIMIIAQTFSCLHASRPPDFMPEKVA